MMEGLTHYHRLRYRLMPYIYTVAANTYYDRGTIMRPLVMDFEADRSVWDIDDEYLFGPSLLVAPVTEFGAREREVYLPAGAEWIDAATGARHAGGQSLTVAAPRERMPLFLRAGAIVPTGEVVQSTATPQVDLTVYVMAGSDGSFTLYEDEGTDMGYQDSEATRITMTWDDASRTLSIGQREGSYPGMAESRSITAVLVDGAGAPVFERMAGKTITYDGAPVRVQF